MYLLLESKQRNPPFRSPIKDNPQIIHDVGTGSGEWARQVVDHYPGRTSLPIHIHIKH